MVKVNITVSTFIRELKNKELKEYKLPELQQKLHLCCMHYKRFKKQGDRTALQEVWSKMAPWYNQQLQNKYPHVVEVYPINYLLDTYK